MATTESTKPFTVPSWVGFPTSTFLNPISSPYNFTNPLSKTVLLIADNNYVSKHVASYLDTTLHVSGFKVTKCASISSTPLFWTQPTPHEHKTDDIQNKADDFWEYKLKLCDFDCVLIPSQIHGDLWNDISSDTKLQFRRFVDKGGSLVCCHFRGTQIINGVCDVAWHEISVKIGASYHAKKANDILKYKNDVRGIVNLQKEDIIYRTQDDLTTVALRKYGSGCCYYIGHDFCAIWEKAWNKILFQSIKKTLTNSEEEIMNLSFGNIDIEAFKNLNIESNKDEAEVKDLYLEEFEPEFKCLKGAQLQMEDGMERKAMEKEDAQRSFDGFDDLNGFEDINEDVATEEEEVLTPQRAKEYESIGYVQMNDDGVITINDNIKLKVEFDGHRDHDGLEVNYNTKPIALERKTNENEGDLEEDDDDESLEEVD